MGFIIGLLTILLVLDCIILTFLVLIQLPKKEAGAGLAFGAGATDALFGAGSGTVLTKVTKYAAAAFFVLAFSLAVIQRHRSTVTTTEFEKQLSKPAATSTLPGAAPAAPSGSATAPTAPAAPVAPSAATTNGLLSTPATATNAPAK